MGTPEVKALLREEEQSPHATLLEGAAGRGGLAGGGTGRSLSSLGLSNTGAQTFVGSSSKQGCSVSIDTCSQANVSTKSER